ncbi:DinB family protein [Oceanobacillus sp. 1P07AA]|uniref:DinB family protein n=1 Tax=Oceanobacillus sp. 1P07AA TaxID=3132293 RepID=UPI0039A435D2
MSNIQDLEKMIENVESIRSLNNKVLQEPIKEGKWSIREIIGHLYGWDHFNAEEMVPLMKHEGRLPEFPDHDSFNAQVIQGLEGVSVEEIITMFIKERRKLVERLKNVDPNARFSIGTGKRRFSQESFARIFASHDNDHLKQIQQKLGEV